MTNVCVRRRRFNRQRRIRQYDHRCRDWNDSAQEKESPEPSKVEEAGTDPSLETAEVLPCRHIDFGHQKGKIINFCCFK